MKRNTTWGGAGLHAALILILAVGCTAFSTTSVQLKPSPNAAVHSFAGGCASTALTDAEPPIWAQGGWSHVKGTPWPVPWAFGTHGSAVAYLFASQLVAGSSPRVDGTNNKVLWVVKDYPLAPAVEGRPLGQPQPVLTIGGGPSIVDVPAAGCWSFRLSWNANGRQTSVINLQALPAGTNPMTLPATPTGA